MAFAGRIWDPVNSNDWDRTVIFGVAPSNRIRSDMKEFEEMAEELPGIFIERDEEKIDLVHALIIGPQGTPYEGGFFYFLIRFSPNYPKDPPRVKLLTTGQGTVRFNPTLYESGMVCLSIINTYFVGGPTMWGESTWTSAQRLWNVLHSIKDVMCKEPYYREPARFPLTGQRRKGSRQCNEYLTHETLRVAVCDMLENPPDGLPQNLRARVRSSFLDNYDNYRQRVATFREIHQGQGMLVLRHDLKEEGRTFDYESIERRLQEIHDSLEPQLDNQPAQ